jgi:nitroreductase
MPEKLLSTVIAERRATPGFLPDPVSEADLRRILDAGLSAPSGYNLQPWRFVVVRDPAQRAKLREAAMGQRKVEEAPVVIVACGDHHDWRRDLDEELLLAERHGWGTEKDHAKVRKNVANFFESPPGNASGAGPDFATWLNRHTMIALTTMMWMAEVLGYDTAPLEGFYEDKVRAALAIPEHVRVVALLAIGHRQGDDKRYAGRLPIHRTVFSETWGTPLRG